MSALSESWGVTYRRAEKRVWFRLEAAERGAAATDSTASGPGITDPGTTGRHSDAQHHDAGPSVHPAHAQGYATESTDRGGPSFLAETSELLAGQLDEAMVTALAAQMLVPRLADWCGIWLSMPGRGLQLSRVWHADEQRITPLREELERISPPSAVRIGVRPGRGRRVPASPMRAGRRSPSHSSPATPTRVYCCSAGPGSRR